MKKKRACLHWTLNIVRGRCVEEGQCWIWSSGCTRHGYPVACINGRTSVSVRSHIFKKILGRNVPDGHVISTLCNNKRCVSPRCLVAKTRGDVLATAYERMARTKPSTEFMRGRRPVKLSLEKAREIRMSNERSSVLAAKYGVHIETIRGVRRGIRWAEPKERPSASIFAWAGSFAEAA